MIWKIPEDTPIDCTIFARPRYPVTNLVLGNNRLSGVAYDFGNFTPLTSGTFPSFTTNTVWAYNQVRTGLVATPTGFQPAGRLERVHMVTNGSGRLTAVREVQIGQTTYNPAANNGTLNVVVRLADQRLADQRLAAGGAAGTLPLAGQTVRLTNRIVLPNGTVTNSVRSGNTGTAGTVTLQFTNLANLHGVCRLAAWWDVGTANQVLDPDRDAWATHSYALGTTVELTASPDVGDDKNTAVAKRAKIRVRRTGLTNSALVVNLTLHSNVVFRPSDNSDLAPKYGTSGDADYSLANGTGTWSTSSPYTSGTITIPAGLASADVQVVTRADNLTEQNLLVARLGQSANYAPGLSTNVHVLIFDGPLWSLAELNTTFGAYYTVSSAAYAINELKGSTQARTAGYGTFGVLVGTNIPSPISSGGYWPLPGLTFNYLENVVYAGISTDPLTLVGALGTNARVTRVGSSNFNLPHLVSSPSAAWGIVSNASLIVGSSRGTNGTLRPTSWRWTGSNYPAFNVGGALNINWAGAAFGANASNQVVGEMQVAYTAGWSGTAAFRSRTGTNVQELTFNPVDGAGDILRAPGTSGTQNLRARASSVNRSGQTVGWYEDINSKRISVSWPSSDLASASVAIDLQAWKAKIGSQADSQSAANDINDGGWIVGWSSTNAVAARAVVKWAATTNATGWMDLNDKHFVHGTTGWVLKEATGVNNLGQIVGNGTYYGSPRAFILIPRAPGN